MTSRISANPLAAGAAAGAVGTVLLDLATYLDMAVTGRAASTVPTQTAAALVERLGLPLPTDDDHASTYGALLGIGTGLGVGVLAGCARRVVVALPAPLASVLIGGAAMAASDASAAALGVTDLRTWSAADWVRDIVPHLLFGIGAHRVLAGSRLEKDTGASTAGGTTSTSYGEPSEGVSGRGTSRSAETATRNPSRRGRLLLRSLALGLASGGRTSLGGVGVARAVGGTIPWVTTAGLVGTELTLDKLPQTPSRLEAGPLVGRAVSGGVGAAALAHREEASWVAPALVGVAGAWLGSVLGAAFRDVAQERGWTWQAAAVEDGTALALTWWAAR